MAVFSDNVTGLMSGQSPSPTEKKYKGRINIELCLTLQASNQLSFKTPADVISQSPSYQTSAGKPIIGIIGVPFLDVIPTEWDVPEHRIVFWLQGQPQSFRHVEHGAIIRCTEDRFHRLIFPVSVHGRRDKAMLDTGADGIYLFDNLISDFPVVESDMNAIGLRLNFRYVVRNVRGIKIGPMTLSGRTGGRLPKYPTKDTVLPFGLVGMVLISRIHFFVIDKQIRFASSSNNTNF